MRSLFIPAVVLTLLLGAIASRVSAAWLTTRGEGARIALVDDSLDTLHPDLIATHAPNDYHSDHRAVSQAVHMAASFKAPVVCFDTLAGTGFEPTAYVDITTHMAAKEAAMRQHASQEPDPHVWPARQSAGAQSVRRARLSAKAGWCRTARDA